MAAISGRRVDLGRLIMVPGAAVMLAFDLRAITHNSRGGAGGGSAADMLRWLGAAAVCAFYALIIWCYLRRGPAVATSGSLTAHAAAVAAMLAPFAFPLLPAVPPGVGRGFAADTLIVAGTAWSVWSLRFLGRSLSVLAQAREVVDRGPYRWVRHPLYTGEIVSSLGLVLVGGTAAAAGLWLALCALQVYRALREEQLLLHALPGYRGYRRRTAALFPGFRRWADPRDARFARRGAAGGDRLARSRATPRPFEPPRQSGGQPGRPQEQCDQRGT
jgi:protein-S-isoprenylcysteine O-methyltransferase Ste14